MGNDEPDEEIDLTEEVDTWKEVYEEVAADLDIPDDASEFMKDTMRASHDMIKEFFLSLDE